MFIIDKRFVLKPALCLVMVLLFTLPAVAVDWPTRLYDNHRGGITTEQLTAASLTQQWVYTTARGPLPAWPEPALQDYGAFVGAGMREKLRPRENFDHCFDVAAVGDYVYFGSSQACSVTCLNAATGGSKVWTFFTDGPVRLAPTVDNGKVYFGSDDGYVYCLNASTGVEIWKERVGPNSDKVWGNDYMISLWPVRSSVLIDGGYAYWSAGLFDSEGKYFCKRNAATGSISGGWTSTNALKFPAQGYLLASSSHIYVACGNSTPTIHNKSNGAFVSYILGNYHDGGCWALLTPQEDHLWAGRALWNNDLNQLDTNPTIPYGLMTTPNQSMAQIQEGNFLIADSTYAYYTTDTTIVKILRSNRSTQWTRTYSYPYSLIKAGTNVYAGGDVEIAAFNASDGTRIWTATVDGKTHGLAVAGGKLYASTDQGSIYCFSAP